MAETLAFRKSVDPLSPGAQGFGAHVHDEAFARTRGTLQERVARVGHPLQLLPLTAFAGVTATGLYPADGDGVAQGGGAGYIDLAANAPAHELAGLGIAIWDDTPSTGWTPEFWRVAAYNTTSKRATLIAVNSEWADHAPRAGSKYALGFITYQREWLRIAAEYESNTTSAAQVIPYYSDLGWDVPTGGDYAGQLGVYGTGRALRWVPGALLTLDRHPVGHLVRQAGYTNGRTRSDECLGAPLAKVALVTAPSTGKVALCAGAS